MELRRKARNAYVTARENKKYITSKEKITWETVINTRIISV
jgi:hypothetical protein